MLIVLNGEGEGDGKRDWGVLKGIQFFEHWGERLRSSFVVLLLVVI